MIITNTETQNVDTSSQLNSKWLTYIQKFTFVQAEECVFDKKHSGGIFTESYVLPKIQIGVQKTAGWNN